jgi:hypothetical protein
MMRLVPNESTTLYLQKLSRLAGVLYSEGGRERLQEAVSLYEQINIHYVRTRGEHDIDTARSWSDLDRAQRKLAEEST